MMTTLKNTMLLAVISLWLVSCGKEGGTKANGTAAGPATSVPEGQNNKTRTVEVVKPVKRSFTASSRIAGKVIPNQKVMVHAMESGVLRTIRKDIGDRVKGGEVIATLSNPDLNRQKKLLLVVVNGKKKTYDRLKSVHDKTPALTPLQMVEDAETAYLSAKTELEGVEDRMRYLQVRAPFSGTVTKRFVHKGAMIQNGVDNTNAQALLEIQQTDPVRITIPFPESDVAALNDDMEINIHFPQLPGQTFTSKISRTAGALDPLSNTMMVEVDVPNPKGTIKPGMYAQTDLKLASSKAGFSLPITAQVLYEDAYFVMVVKDNVVERIPLQKGLSNADYFEVLNADINAQTMVIVKGKGLVKPGQTVDPILKAE